MKLRALIATASTLHVVFNPSAAGSLRQALDLAGRDEIVIGLFDDFSFGPISSSDPDVRARWVEDVLGFSWGDVVVENAPFLAASRSAAARRADLEASFLAAPRCAAGGSSGLLSYPNWRRNRDDADRISDQTGLAFSLFAKNIWGSSVRWPLGGIA